MVFLVNLDHEVYHWNPDLIQEKKVTRYLSGIQPSGIPHLGNYFGAIKPHIELSKSMTKDDLGLFFIADLHALTTFSNRKELEDRVKAVAATYLALGLDTTNSAFFRQSDIPEVTELSWILGCCTSVGLLQRAHSYKDKVAKGLVPNVGLFTYPVLMAADILIYRSDVVPVGKDQVQHVEMANDMATHFNESFCEGEELLKHPKVSLSPESKVVGTDGSKMSKSYKNTIDIFSSGKHLKKRVSAVVTDSRPPEEPKDPEELPVFQILKCFLSEEETKDLGNTIRDGGEGAPGYGYLKSRLINRIDLEFEEARKKYEVLLNTQEGADEIEQVLAEGAAKARQIAQQTMQACYEKIGMPNRGK